MHNLIRWALQTEYTEPRAPDWIDYRALVQSGRQTRVYSSSTGQTAATPRAVRGIPRISPFAPSKLRLRWGHDRRHGIRRLRTLATRAPTLRRYRAILRTRRHGPVTGAG